MNCLLVLLRVLSDHSVFIRSQLVNVGPDPKFES